ncbi:uncharacterized protein LOC143253098 isoform X2 [Tachypleus tridentatus]|uniref:uncharacterized protein LOC143253098 isoform X2 n=1 Tax=Tachypleus tridentatus TaxID=6853 RepID=UPI003FD2EF6D
MDTCHETILTQVGIGEVNLVASSMVKMDMSHETVKILTDKLEVMELKQMTLPDYHLSKLGEY